MRSVEYVLGVKQGVIVGAFEANEWLEATTANFPDKEPMDGRWGFVGEIAPPEVQNIYLRKRIPESMRKRGAANPIRYHFHTTE